MRGERDKMDRRTERPILLPRKDWRVSKTWGDPGPWVSRRDALDVAYGLSFGRCFGGLESRWVAPVWWPWKEGEL